MQGPFSMEMNLALLHQTEAAYFVTKETGRAGGFEEKAEAAETAGAVLVVIGRPEKTARECGESKGKTPCNAYFSVIYYECCKKTRMRIFLTVPTRISGRSQGRKHAGRSKTKWRKET